jgi:septum formation protein
MNSVRIVLGSKSPRRKELLGSLGLNFEIIDPAIVEQKRTGELPLDYVVRNASAKGLEVARRVGPNQAALVISADTIVSVGPEIYEKPNDAAHHKTMLEQLSGIKHMVTTAVSIRSTSSDASFDFHVTSDVLFKQLTAKEIDYYVGTGEGGDKAGGYAVQGLGGFMVQAIHGSYTNVIGLPLAELISALRERFKLTWP